MLQGNSSESEQKNKLVAITQIVEATNKKKKLKSKKRSKKERSFQEVPSDGYECKPPHSDILVDMEHVNSEKEKQRKRNETKKNTEKVDDSLPSSMSDCEPNSKRKKYLSSQLNCTTVDTTKEIHSNNSLSCKTVTNKLEQKPMSEDTDTVLKKKKRKDKKQKLVQPEVNSKIFQGNRNYHEESFDEIHAERQHDFNKDIGDAENSNCKIKKKKRSKNRSQEVVKVDKIHPALVYLSAWKNDNKNWTFKKVRQVWLLQHLYDTKIISDKNFEILLEYLQGAKGAAKVKTIEKAEQYFNENNVAEDENVKEKVKRARQIIQFLSL